MRIRVKANDEDNFVDVEWIDMRDGCLILLRGEKGNERIYRVFAPGEWSEAERIEQ